MVALAVHDSAEDGPDVAIVRLTRLLDARDQPLGGMDDPDQVAAARLGGALGLDTSDTAALLHALRRKEAP
jgi:hypothetical protein